MKAIKLCILIVLALTQAITSMVLAQGKPKSGDTISGGVSGIVLDTIVPLDNNKKGNGKPIPLREASKAVETIDISQFEHLGVDTTYPQEGWEKYEPLDSREMRDIAERMSKGRLDISFNTTDPGFYPIKRTSGNTTVSESAPDVKDSPQAGDIISGVVFDDEGPMMMVNVTERDAADRFMAHDLTVMDGSFSFKLVNPKDRLVVTYVGYEKVDVPIDSTYFEIKMKDEGDFDTIIIMDGNHKGIPIPLRDSSDDIPEIDMLEFESLGFSTIDEVLNAKCGLDLPWDTEE